MDVLGSGRTASGCWWCAQSVGAEIMKNRYVWIGTCSVLAHLVLFWPEPNRPGDGRRTVISVRLPDYARGQPPKDETLLMESAETVERAVPMENVAHATPEVPNASGRARTIPAHSVSRGSLVDVSPKAAIATSLQTLGRDGTVAEGGDSDDRPGLLRYRIALASAAVKRVRAELSGAVMQDAVYSLTVEVSGLEAGVTAVRIIASSGRAGLDDMVLRAVELAAGDVPHPFVERGKPWAFTLPVSISQELEAL